MWLALQRCNWAKTIGLAVRQTCSRIGREWWPSQATECSYSSGPDRCFEQRILHSSQLLAWASAAQLCTPTSDLPSSCATPPTCRPSDVLIAAKAELHHVAGLSLYSTVRTVQPYPRTALYLKAPVRGHAAAALQHAGKAQQLRIANCSRGLCTIRHHCSRWHALTG